MKDFRTGVSWYTTGSLPVTFPEDDLCCWHCPLMGMESRSDRHYCRRTGEYLPAPRDILGTCCPIEFDKKEDE